MNLRPAWVLLTVMAIIGAIGGIAYGGGLKSVYIDNAHWAPWTMTVLIMLSIWGLWRTRRR